MKRHEEDDKIAKLLKEQFPEAGKNEWFTPRVLNRLPDKHKAYPWMSIVVYFVAFIICAFCWVAFVLNQKFTVITVANVCEFVIMAAVTATLFYNVIKTAMR
jgi:membrane protein YqaA with SNARE-associated domain